MTYHIRAVTLSLRISIKNNQPAAHKWHIFFAIEDAVLAWIFHLEHWFDNNHRGYRIHSILLKAARFCSISSYFCSCIALDLRCSAGPSVSSLEPSSSYCAAAWYVVGKHSPHCASAAPPRARRAVTGQGESGAFYARTKTPINAQLPSMKRGVARSGEQMLEKATDAQSCSASLATLSQNKPGSLEATRSAVLCIILRQAREF